MQTYNVPDTIDVLTESLVTLRGDGDPHPCNWGTWCVRCAIAMAASRLSDKYSLPMGMTDQALESARDAIRIAGGNDRGCSLTRESAIATVEAAIRWVQSWAGDGTPGPQEE